MNLNKKPLLFGEELFQQGAGVPGLVVRGNFAPAVKILSTKPSVSVLQGWCRLQQNYIIDEGGLGQSDS